MYDCGLERTLMMIGLSRDTESYGVWFEVSYRFGGQGRIHYFFEGGGLKSFCTDGGFWHFFHKKP